MTPSDIQLFFSWLIFLWLLWAFGYLQELRNIWIWPFWESVHCFVGGGPLVSPTLQFSRTSLCSLNLTWCKSHLLGRTFPTVHAVVLLAVFWCFLTQCDSVSLAVDRSSALGPLLSSLSQCLSVCRCSSQSLMGWKEHEVLGLDLSWLSHFSTIHLENTAKVWRGCKLVFPFVCVWS